MNADILVGQNASAVDDEVAAKRALTDLMYEGFYVFYLLKSGCEPGADLKSKVHKFLDDLEISSKKMIESGEISRDDLNAVKYAFCATLDEIILRSNFSLREAWGKQPLQMELFGDLLSGENFFKKMDEFRLKGSRYVQVLEVYYMCLLMGFEGKYALDGREKLNYLISRLGDEIMHLKGKKSGFSPHWSKPENIVNKLRNEVPIWVFFAVFALIALLGYLGLSAALVHSTQSSVVGYDALIKLAPTTSSLLIVFP